VGHCLPKLLLLAHPGGTEQRPPAADALQPLSELLAACLDGLRLDLTVSGTTAAAARQLLASRLGPPLLEQLGSGGAGGGGVKEPQLLLLLMRLFASTIRWVLSE